MSTLNLGMGLCPFGTARFGFGQPATATGNVSSMLQDSSGVRHDSRYIDPSTRDYKIDTYGIVQGQSSTAQQVYFALITTVGSSAVAGLGSTLSEIKTINLITIRAAVTDKVTTALSNLIETNLIELVSVDCTVLQSRIALSITVQWRDLTTNQVNQTTI